jgi:hypothetical protein
MMQSNQTFLRTQPMDIWQYVRPLDIATCAQSFQSAQPFPSICIDDLLVETFANQVLADFPSYENAQQMGRGFKSVNERGKVQVTDAALFQGALLRLHEILASPEFLAVMSGITGIQDLQADAQLVGGGVHQTGPRGHLDVHVDFNYIVERRLHRRLNIIVFLNKDWRPEWGGALELWDKRVKRCYHTFLPIFNRCVVFETSEISYHGVTAVTCPPDISRKSFAAYYYTVDNRPEIARERHSTIFVARPHERWKRWVAMPLERMQHAARSSSARLKSAIKRMVRS